MDFGINIDDYMYELKEKLLHRGKHQYNHKAVRVSFDLEVRDPETSVRLRRSLHVIIQSPTGGAVAHLYGRRRKRLFQLPRLF